MGAPLAETVIRAGYPTRLYDVNPASVRALADQAAGDVIIAGSPGEATLGSEIVIVTVNDDAQAIAAITGPAGVLSTAVPGTVVAIHSTISQPTLRTIAEQAAERGVEVLDAGISGELGHHSIPNLVVMAGGDEKAFERATPVMRCYASLVLRLGPLGAGLDAKLALNVLRYLSFLIHREVRDLVTAAGTGTEFARIVDHVRATQYRDDLDDADTPDREAVEQRRRNVLIARKDLDAAAARARELGVELPMVAASRPELHRIWYLTADLGKMA
jgi:3-hydroxyisobutyrate dehydrogenase